MSRLTKALALALGAAVLLRLVLLAWLPLMDPAEGRYGEIGRKMAELGDWITPWHQYGVPFWGKPPLSFWMTAASLDWFGINEFAARLPHFLAGVATAWCVWNVARNGHTAQWAASSTQRGDGGSDQGSRPHEALMAAAMLGTGLLFFLSSGAVMTDAALVLGTTMATMGAWLAMAGIDEGQRRRQGWLAFLGGAMGILAKGPLALVLVGTPLLLWAAWNGRWRVLWTALPWVRGVLLMVALCAPWFVAAEMKTPGFFEYFFVGEHFHRFATPGWSGDLYGKAHHEPKGTIWLYAAGACLPWTVLLPALAVRRFLLARANPGAGHATRRDSAGTQNPPETLGPWNITPTEESRFVMLWALVPLLFFTVSSNIIWTYVLPAMPGLAWWAARWMGRNPGQGMRWTTAGVWVAVVAWAALAMVADRIGRLDRASAKALVVACDAAWARHQGAPSAAQQAARDGLRGDAAEPRLILLGRRSFSSHFYTHGRTLRVDALNEVGMRWPAAGVCLAVKEDDPDSMAAAQAGVQMVEALGSHHERRLWWVRRP
jgi:4-amino-4-deoxy-L-arabinose transferase-like glycosyltransferase